MTIFLTTTSQTSRISRSRGFFPRFRTSAAAAHAAVFYIIIITAAAAAAAAAPRLGRCRTSLNS